MQRRLLLPTIGCVLTGGACLAIVRPAMDDTSRANASRAIWAAQPAQAVEPMLHALRLDPGSPERWADLAEVMHETGRDEDTRYCLDQELA